MALASLSVHVPASQWSSDGGVVRWFADKLQAAPPDAALPCLLELLIVLPQEANSSRVAVRPERRRQHAQDLASCVALALEILSSCLNQPGERTKELVLEAFGAWLKLSSARGLLLPMGASALSEHPLTAAALSGLGSTQTFYASVDAVCELVWSTVDSETSVIHEPMMPMIQKLVSAVMSLRPRFAVAARRFAAEQGGGSAEDVGGARDDFDDDEDTSKGMARLFCEVADAYMALIATAVKEVWAPVEAMLEVAAYPDFSIAAMSYHFWSKLARQVRCSSLDTHRLLTP